MDPEFSVRFWGTRGLISSPSPDTALFGGNTPCIQLLHQDDLIVIDTGFGVSILGEQLMPRIIKDKEKLNVHIFYTHFHWDHIQGLPFFHPIYFPSSTLNFYSPMNKDLMHENLDLLFDGSYSPFSGIDNMASEIVFHHLSDPLQLASGLSVNFKAIDHITDCFAYRFEHPDGRSVVIATDHEARSGERNSGFQDFASGCSLLVHDAQYTADEYRSREGWGHSTIDQAIANACTIAPAKTLLTNHHPTRTDSQIQSLHRYLRRNDGYRGQDIEFAREEVVYPIPASSVVSQAG